MLGSERAIQEKILKCNRHLRYVYISGDIWRPLKKITVKSPNVFVKMTLVIIMCQKSTVSQSVSFCTSVIRLNTLILYSWLILQISKVVTITFYEIWEMCFYYFKLWLYFQDKVLNFPSSYSSHIYYNILVPVWCGFI